MIIKSIVKNLEFRHTIIYYKYIKSISIFSNLMLFSNILLSIYLVNSLITGQLITPTINKTFSFNDDIICDHGYIAYQTNGTDKCINCILNLNCLTTCTSYYGCNSCLSNQYSNSTQIGGKNLNFCLACPSNCTTCLNSSWCTECTLNFYLVNITQENITSQICQGPYGPFCPATCLECSNSSWCTECNPRYNLTNYTIGDTLIQTCSPMSNNAKSLVVDLKILLFSIILFYIKSQRQNKECFNMYFMRFFSLF